MVPNTAQRRADAAAVLAAARRPSSACATTVHASLPSPSPSPSPSPPPSSSLSPSASLLPSSSPAYAPSPALLVLACGHAACTACATAAARATAPEAQVQRLLVCALCGTETAPAALLPAPAPPTPSATAARCSRCEADVDDSDAVADTLCTTCGAGLCADHAGLHRRSTSTRGHTLVPAADARRALTDAVAAAEGVQDALVDALGRVRALMTVLGEDSERMHARIAAEFSKLRLAIAARRAHLHAACTATTDGAQTTIGADLADLRVALRSFDGWVAILTELANAASPSWSLVAPLAAPAIDVTDVPDFLPPLPPREAAIGSLAGPTHLATWAARKLQTVLDATLPPSHVVAQVVYEPWTALAAQIAGAGFLSVAARLSTSFDEGEADALSALASMVSEVAFPDTDTAGEADDAPEVDAADEDDPDDPDDPQPLHFGLGGLGGPGRSTTYLCNVLTDLYSLRLRRVLSVLRHIFDLVLVEASLERIVSPPCNLGQHLLRLLPLWPHSEELTCEIFQLVSIATTRPEFVSTMMAPPYNMHHALARRTRSDLSTARLRHVSSQLWLHLCTRENASRMVEPACNAAEILIWIAKADLMAPDMYGGESGLFAWTALSSLAVHAPLLIHDLAVKVLDYYTNQPSNVVAVVCRCMAAVLEDADDAARTMVVKDPYKLHKHVASVLEFYQGEEDSAVTLIPACRLLICLASRDATTAVKLSGVRYHVPAILLHILSHSVESEELATQALTLLEIIFRARREAVTPVLRGDFPLCCELSTLLAMHDASVAVAERVLAILEFIVDMKDIPKLLAETRPYVDSAVLYAMHTHPDNAKIQRMGCHLLYKIVVPAARVQPDTARALREAAARFPDDAALQNHVRLTLERLRAR